MTDPQTSLMQSERTRTTHKVVTQWKGQRISGAALISLGIWFLIEILRHTQADYFLVLAWASQPWVSISLILFVSMVFYHSAIGLQVIIEDYIPHPFWQKSLIFVIKMLNLSMALLSCFFIIHIMIMGNG
ncbi:MAG: succinate dehydrogenase, hydrophobic membrane anchor protein [Candidatus Paracaedibacter sp.]